MWLALSATLQGCSSGKSNVATVPAEEDMSAYLMVFHKDDTHSVHMAISHDGYTFTALNDGNPVIKGDSIAMQRGIRDPHIFRGPDGGFYLSATDLHIFAKEAGYRDTECERDFEVYGWGNNRGLVLLKSFDLINWTHTAIDFSALAEGLEEIGCAWAPEVVYDDKAGKLMLHYTMRFKNGLNKLYYVYVNDDFDRVETLPQLLFEYSGDVASAFAIDSDITKIGDKYHLFYVVNYETSGIMHAVSDRIDGGYVYEERWYDFEPTNCEAPNIWKRIGEDRWVLMYDCFGIEPNNFRFAETTDFVNFTDLGYFNDGVMKTTNFVTPKHGAVIQITAEEADRLEKYWGGQTVR